MERLKDTYQDSDYPDDAICYYCGGKLKNADHKDKKKFGFVGRTKDGELKYYCWNCH